MMRICAPQHGHGSRNVSGLVTFALSSSGVFSGAGTLSSSRAFAILALRLLLASKP